MKPPINLRVEQEPYPHLRDDEGCVLARDYQHPEKLAFILEAVAVMCARRNTFPRVKMCEECGKHPADLPSKICVGCDAYREHQR